MMKPPKKGIFENTLNLAMSSSLSNYDVTKSKAGFT